MRRLLALVLTFVVSALPIILAFGCAGPSATPTPTGTAMPGVTTTPGTPAPSPTGGTQAGTPAPTTTRVPAPTPQPTPTPTRTPGPTPVPTGLGAIKYPGLGYGMQVNPGYFLDRALGLLTGAGFNWAKVQIQWDVFEPTKGRVSFDTLDTIVNTARARNVRIMMTITGVPTWALRPGANTVQSGPPAKTQDFVDFIGAVATRYKGKVQAYEIFNETNHAGWSGKWTAAEYVDVLKAAFQKIRSVDPDAVVVSAAPTPGDVPGIVVDDVAWVDQMYQAGLKNYSDVIGVHTNIASANPPDAWIPDPCPAGGRKCHGSFYFKRIQQIYEVMKKYGDGGKQIWSTEHGWASIENVTTKPAPGYEYAAEVTEKMQADFLVRSFQLAKESLPYVGVMFVWNLNYNADPNDEKAAWSILYQDWPPRPAYNALKAMPKN